MKKAYVSMSVFCCFFLLLCGCKKTSYFEAKEEVKEEAPITTEASENEEDAVVPEEPTPTNVYVYIYPKEGYEYIVTDEPVDVADYAGKTNLNTATASALMELPGIGESKAQSILAYRDEHGKFQKVEDLMEIPGIKEGVYSKIADRIYVN